jgi:C4-dicarboxylate-specific signal transduction histidine kinase
MSTRRSLHRGVIAAVLVWLLAASSDAAPISALTGSIAHELSQPLNAILHSMQAGELLVAGNRATPDALRKILADIHTADVRATQIIERHRTMLRNRQLDAKPVDIDAVVRATFTVTLPRQASVTLRHRDVRRHR